MKVIVEPRQETMDIRRNITALIREARRRQRRRWKGVAIILLAVVLSGVTYVVVAKSAKGTSHTGTSVPNNTTSATPGPFVSPQAPYALAVAPNGDLLVVDSGRDQILRRLPSGRFQVLAGDGKRGFSGERLQAVRARINVDNWAGIAASENGTVYFADDGNSRVREVLPSGIIETVAGGGTPALGRRTMPALGVSLKGVAGLTMGPNSELYIGANAVYRLGPGAILHWVVGTPFPFKDWPRAGVVSFPILRSSLTSSLHTVWRSMVRATCWSQAVAADAVSTKWRGRGRLRFVGCLSW